jgi:hypothetical protein
MADRGQAGIGDWAQVTASLEELQRDVAQLVERVAALEAAAAKDRGQPSVEPRTSNLEPQTSNLKAQTSNLEPQTSNLEPRPKQGGISEELLLVISAAVAAFLGKKPHIRQIRLLGATAWAQQGRVTIQASHTLPALHARSQL